MTKCREGSLQALADFTFWIVVEICHKKREPLMHFYRWLIKAASGDSEVAFLVLALVGSIAPSVAAEIERLLATLDDWMAGIIDRCDAACLLKGLPSNTELRGDLTSLARDLLLCYAAAFHRRVTKLLSRCAP